MLRKLYQNSASDGQNRRPVGVSIVAVLCLAGALIALIGGITSGQLAGVALTVLLLAIGAGLWRLKAWAKWLAVGGLAVAVLVIAVDALARYGLGAGLSTALSLILSRSLAPLAIALYLLHPSITRVFTK